MAAVVVVMAGTPAQSRPWTLADLGRVPKENHCMRAAGQTFQSLLGTHRIDALYQTAWAIHADGISGDHDAVITCTHGNARGTRATLVLHSRGKPGDARFVTRRIQALYDGHARHVVQTWRDSFN